MPASNCPVDPFSQSQIIENPKIFNLNYTNQDFWSMKSRALDFINERFGPEGSEIPNTFNDLVEGSVAIMLIETWSFLADTLSFKIDQVANEVFVDSVTEKENMFRLARLVGFDPTPPTPSRSLWSGTINNVLSSDVVVDTPFPVDIATDDGEPLRIELFRADSNNDPVFGESILIPAGKIITTAIVGLEGTSLTDSFEATGAIGQNLSLTQFPVLFDSIAVSVDGVTWDRVDFFTDSQPRLEYRVEFDSDFAAFIIFGNGRAGFIPSDGSTVQVSYRVGGGTAGNIVTGFITTQAQSFAPGINVPIPISFTNYTKGEFGSEGDSLEDVRRKLPEFLRTQNRAVTGLDYKTLAENFTTPFQGQIGRATAVLRNHGCAGNVIDMYILAKNGDDLQEASSQLKAELSEELEDKKMLTDLMCIKDGEIISVDITIEAIANRSQKKFELEITENINQRINNFFLLANWEFGKTLKTQDIIKELSDIRQITSYEIQLITPDPDNSGASVAANFFEIIRPDTIEVSILFE